MYVYDMDGTLLWQKDLGDKKMRNQFGEGSTPVLAGDRLVIVWDHLAGSRSSWRSTRTTDASCGAQSRDEIDTWATPLVVEHERTRAGDRARARTRSAATTSRPARSSGRARA